jgi:hypothetical protein
MDTQMTQAKFLASLQVGRAEWEALLAQVPAERLTQPGAAGGWTVKDVIAHITWHEKEIVEVLQSHDFTIGSEWWNLPTAERNERIYGANRDRPLQEVLHEAPQVYQQLLALLQNLDDTDFVDPGRFKGMPDDWLPWRIFAGNSYEHYEQHVPSLQAFIGG